MPLKTQPPRLYKPEGQAHTQFIKKAHDSPTGGHLSEHKTHESLHCLLLYWPKCSTRCMNEYVHTCIQCLRTKSTNQTPVGLLQPLPLPNHCRQQDLVTGLPRSGHRAAQNGYPLSQWLDTIITFVNRLSKRVLSVPQALWT
jgi:hypothetical protein